MKTKAAPSPTLPKRISLVTQTAQSLRDALRAGHWQEHLPGERELCARLQVSRITLRAALDELQRAGLLEVAPGQRRSIKVKPARSGAGAHSRVIALISPEPLLALAPVSMFLADELRKNLARAGFNLELHVSAACYSAHPARALDDLVARSSAAAWVVFGSREPMQNWFIRYQLPCLVAGSCALGTGLPSMDFDYRATCRHAGGWLRSKGHRHIALILPEGAYGGDMDSEQGFREALAGDGATTLLVLRHDGTAAHLCALLDKALRRAHPPTACIVARAMHVLTVMMHLMQRGLRIPRDMAVLSRDDENFLQHAIPSVARYAASPTQYARRLSLAARKLAETGALRPRAIRIMPELIAGESV